MELYEAIENRRTIRNFKGPASEEQLKKIILAGTKAPSAVNRQPWEFIIVKDERIVEQLAEIKYQQTKKYPPEKVKGDPDAMEKLAQDQKDSFRNASIVAVCHLCEWERSVWMCLENISLAAVAEGLGSCITLYWGEGQKEAEPHFQRKTGVINGCFRRWSLGGNRAGHGYAWSCAVLPDRRNKRPVRDRDVPAGLRPGYPSPG